MGKRKAFSSNLNFLLKCFIFALAGQIISTFFVGWKSLLWTAINTIIITIFLYVIGKIVYGIKGQPVTTPGSPPQQADVDEVNKWVQIMVIITVFGFIFVTLFYLVKIGAFRADLNNDTAPEEDDLDLLQNHTWTKTPTVPAGAWVQMQRIKLSHSDGFNPKTFEVRNGTFVIFAATTSEPEHSHGITIDEFGVNAVINSTTAWQPVTFLADKKGKFRIWCKPCLDGPYSAHDWMEAELIVR